MHQLLVFPVIAAVFIKELRAIVSAVTEMIMIRHAVRIIVPQVFRPMRQLSSFSRLKLEPGAV